MDLVVIPSRLISRLNKWLQIMKSLIIRIPHVARFIQFISTSSLYKGVLILGFGTVMAQLVGILSMPIITRLYTPSDLGVLAVYSSILAIIGAGATLRYEFAFPLPKEDSDAINLFGLCLILLIITTTLLAAGLFLGSEIVTSYYGDYAVIKPYLWFLIPGFIGLGFYTILNYWAVRKRDYKRITYTTINRGFGSSITTVSLGLLSFGPIGLIIGYIISQVAGIGTLARIMWKKDRENLKKISLNRIQQVTLTYKSFPIFNLPASIVNTISLQVPSLMFLFIYDARIAGLYALANIVVITPGSVISGSMAQAYFGEVSRMVREKSQGLLSLYINTLKHLTVIAIPLIGIPSLCAPFVFGLIFGEAWTEAGWYCWPLGLMVISGFAVSPTSNLSTYGYNHWQLSWDVIRTASVIGSFFAIIYYNLSPIYALLVYGIIMIIMYCLLYFLNIIAINRFSSMIEVQT